MVNTLGVGLLAVGIGFAATSDWESVLGIGLGGFWAFVVGLILYRREKQQVDGNWWGRVTVAGLIVRLLAALLHLAVGFWFYGGVSDFISYHQAGVTMAGRFLRGDLIHIETARGIIQFRLLEHLLGLFTFMVGPGIVGMALLCAVVGFIGIYLFLQAFRLEFPYGKDTRFFALALFFLPSMAFWGTYPGKDPWILLFLGWLSYSFTLVLRRFRIRYLLGIVVSLAGLTLLRWPVAGLAALTLAVTWLLKSWKGPAMILRPIGLAVSPLVVVGILTYMGLFFPTKPASLINDPVAFLDDIAQHGVLFHMGYTGEAASSRSVEITDRSLGGILRYLPQGAFAFLFRPMIFEAHHLLAVAAALEATFFLALILLRWRNLAAVMRLAFIVPFIAYSVAIFIGLTVMLALEVNFGAIVRHRAMVLPFLLIMLAIPFERKKPGENAS